MKALARATVLAVALAVTAGTATAAPGAKATDALGTWYSTLRAEVDQSQRSGLISALDAERLRDQLVEVHMLAAAMARHGANGGPTGPTQLLLAAKLNAVQAALDAVRAASHRSAPAPEVASHP